MKWQLYTDADFENAKYSDKLRVRCSGCSKIVYRTKFSILNSFLKKIETLYCSTSCGSKNSSQANRTVSTRCSHCSKPLRVQFYPYTKSKTKRFFCNKSCSGTYNNTHKVCGTRVSKLEKWLQEQLRNTKLDIYFNQKDAINSELDIYIPSLKLAFELNGIYHYEPIHGPELLSKIQNNDNRKFQACLERGIELCIIDTTKQKYFKVETAKQYLDIILDVIKLAESRLLENQPG